MLALLLGADGPFFSLAYFCFFLFFLFPRTVEMTSEERSALSAAQHALECIVVVKGD